MNTFDKVCDSGEREKFSTGSQRDTRWGKGRFDLIPYYPMYRVARHFENGGAKYDDWNWSKGQELSRYLDSAERHIGKWKGGDDEEDHLAAAVWNLLCLIWTERAVKVGLLPAELDDLNERRKQHAKLLLGGI